MTTIPEHVQEVHIEQRTLASILKEIVKEDIQSVSWNCSPLGKSKEESSVFRVHCTAAVSDKQMNRSLILKILKPDSQRDDASHYYYWKREALVYRSEILSGLPDMVTAPKCYAVEEQADGDVWIWLEDVAVEPRSSWSMDEQIKIAYMLGMYNGSYLTHTPVPSESFLCKRWMRSWVEVCKSYARSIDEQKAVWDTHVFDFAEKNKTWERYQNNLSRIDALLETLDLLPRVFAHQDVHWDNIFLENKNGRDTLVAIDWQFASVSGVGEELGRMVGYSLLKKIIPIDQVNEYKESLFQSYMDGLREAGWNGNSDLVRYGFNVTAALRFVMVVDKLVRVAGDSKSGSLERMNELVLVAQALMDMADEAWNLIEPVKHMLVSPHNRL